MRGNGRRVRAAAAAMLGCMAVACGGGGGPGADGGPTVVVADGGERVADAGEFDAGTVDAGEFDAGTVDAGEFDAGEPDAGDADAGEVDAGTPDAGPLAQRVLHAGPLLAPPTEVVGSAEGLSHEVSDASHDAAGNLWAVDTSHLYLRRAGLGAFESFGTGDGLKGDDILGVSGGTAGVAWVGYKGQGDSNDDPEWMRHTGGAGRATLHGADIDVLNLELSSPPGTYPQYPDGRYKLRTCYRAVATKSGPHAGDTWFGCNHGVGLVSGPNAQVTEHHHPAFCAWNVATQNCTLHAGDVPAVARTASGDVWFGGTYGVMEVDYDQGAGAPKFWGPEPVRNLLLWEHPISPNQYGSNDVTGLAVAGDGSLWASSAHSGLAHRLADGRIELVQETEGLPSNDLTDVAADGANGLWIATEQLGVFRLDLDTNEIRQVPNLPSGLARRVVYEQTDAGPVLTVTVRGGIGVYRGTGAP